MARARRARGNRGLAVVLGLLHGLAAGSTAATGAGRQAPARTSLADSLEAADLCLVARVIAPGEAPAGGGRLEPIAVLKGGPVEGPIELPPPPGDLPDRIPAEARFEPGEVAVALLARTGEGWAPLGPPFRGRIGLGSPTPERLEEARELLRGYLERLPRRTGDSAALASFLKQRVAVSDVALRGAVLADLAPLLGPDDLGFLLGLLPADGRPEDLRLWALRMIGVLAPPALPPELASLLEPGESVRIRQATLQVAGARRDPAGLTLLVRGLGDPDPAVRKVAVDAVELPAAVPPLATAFRSEADPEVRLAIVAALARIATPQAAEELRWIQAHADSEQLRNQAGLALRAVRSSSAP